MAEIRIEAVTQAQTRLPYLQVVPQLRAIIH
jgi:hypothetical protein